MAKLRPLGDKFLGKHKNAQVREMYALLKASAEKHRPQDQLSRFSLRELGRRFSGPFSFQFGMGLRWPACSINGMTSSIHCRHSVL